MKKFIPYDKLSKKEKRKQDLAKRKTWGELNPVTRKPENSKAYNRKKSQNWKRGLPLDPAIFFLTFLQYVVTIPTEYRCCHRVAVRRHSFTHR